MMMKSTECAGQRHIAERNFREPVDTVAHPGDGDGRERRPEMGGEGETEGQDDFEEAGREGEKYGEGQEQTRDDGPGVELIEVVGDQRHREEPRNDAADDGQAKSLTDDVRDDEPPRRISAGRVDGDFGINVFRPGRDVLHADHQRQHDDKAELETGVVNIQRVQDENRQATEGEQLNRVDGAIAQDAKAEDDAKKDRAEHRRRRQGNEAVEHDGHHRDDCDPARMAQPAEEPVDEHTQDGDVHSADGEVVAGAGAAEFFLDVAKFGVAVAENEGAEEGLVERLFFGEAAAEGGADGFSNASEQRWRIGVEDLQSAPWVMVRDARMRCSR